MKFLIADPQALKAIEDYAKELDQRADALDDASERPQGLNSTEDPSAPAS